MSHPRQFRRLSTCAIAALLLTLHGSAILQAAPDPVDELRKALYIRQEDRENLTNPILTFRRETLEKRIAALRSLSDLRRALMEWKEDPGTTLDPKLRELRNLDEEMRKKVGTRLRAGLEKASKSDTANIRLAAANMIAEMGPTIRSLDPADTGGFARSLAPIVVTLADDRDLAVRQQALRALGSINASPKVAVPQFVRTLENDKGVGSRRLAAYGLVQMVRVVSHLYKKEQTKSTGVLASQSDLVEISTAVVRAAGAGFNDADSEVRSLCLEAVQASAAAFGDLPGAFEKKDFPPIGRPLSEAEQKEIKLQYDFFQTSVDEMRPLLVAMADQGKFFDAVLEDPEQRVRLAASAAVEQMSHIRLRLHQRLNSLPHRTKRSPDGTVLNESVVPKVAFPVVDQKFDMMIVARRDSAARLLQDKSIEIRRSAIDYMENIEDAALPAIPALTEALADHDRFIRWAAARTLGNLPAAKASVSVPAMIPLLEDNDLDVRLAVAATLEKMGPFAKDAADALDKGIFRGDAEFRMACMYALESMGPDNAQIAIPNLVKSLANEDARVRRTAAEVLGRFGPLAQSAIPALRQLLGDDDPEVRSRASDALLNILE